MKYVITLKDRITSYQIDYKQLYNYQDTEHATADQHVRSQWLEGNYQCDCNRALFLWNYEGEELPCNSFQDDIDQRIDLLKIVDTTGRQVWPIEPEPTCVICKMGFYRADQEPISVSDTEVVCNSECKKIFDAGYLDYYQWLHREEGSTSILLDITKHYLMGKLPENITVRMVEYKRIAGEIILVSDVPEWQQFTLEEITIDDHVLVVGYGPQSRTLMIGQEDEEDLTSPRIVVTTKELTE